MDSHRESSVCFLRRHVGQSDQDFDLLYTRIFKAPFSIIVVLIMSPAFTNLEDGPLAVSPQSSCLLQLDFVSGTMTMNMAWC